MNKKETINNIKNISSLIQLVTNICKESGLIEIERLAENVIVAVEKGALKRKVIKFIITLSELKGKVPQIKECIKKYTDITDEIIIVSSYPKQIANYFKEWLVFETKTTKLDYWSQNELIEKIDEVLPHYWGHNDLFLKSYEDHFLKDIKEEIELKKILKLDSKFEELLNVFIEPKIYIFKEDNETERTTRVKIQSEKLLKKENFIISGEAGTGKSTLLKHIGKMAIDCNHEKPDRVLPLFIKPSDLQENNYSINDTIEKLLVKDFGIDDLKKIFNDYHILLLIDSIDELEKDNRKIVLTNLSKRVETCNCNFILSTRNYESITNGYELSKHFHAQLSNFDQRQVKLYLDHFFKFDLSRANQLWENLLENNILDRIPVTPLTISLISILYEERQYEVPATLTDIYDNFNQFLLGRANVKTNLEFLDINIKERVLSIYAFDIIRTPNRLRKSRDEFIEFVKDFFAKKSITIDGDLVPELMNSLTDGTGVLYVDDKNFVTFKHDHFMEYYASREIFIQHNRTDLEKELIDKFTEYNWQNTTIFYTGRTKDMPEFLENLIKKVAQHTNLNDCLLSVSGLGYILQSLWMTDSKIRMEGVITALDLLLKADSRVKVLASEKMQFFKGIRDIDIAFLNLIWFYNHFNSVAIRDPLNLAFDKIHKEVQQISGTVFDSDKMSRLYQLFCIASTLDTGRNADSQKLTVLFDVNEILHNPFFVLLFEEGSKILEMVNGNRLKTENKTKSKLQKYIHAIRFYLETPSDELMYTTYDQLLPIKKIKIITEGKTDAIIISHAFAILTSYKEPYWNISSVDKVKHKDGGGANELKKYLEDLGQKISLDSDSKTIVIGIFDNDAKGNQEFGGLNNNFELHHKCLKKHIKHNIFAIKIPIPDQSEFDPYRQDKQEFKFFEIEHYFPKVFLLKNNMINETAIPNIFEISNKKTEFAEIITKEDDENIFINFPTLFRVIDEISGFEINYIE